MDDQKNQYFKLIEIPEDELITLDYLSTYEIAHLISANIKQINQDNKIYLEPDEILIDVKDIEPEIKKNISNVDIINYNGQTYIKLTNTTDIAKAQLNKNKCPFLIVRERSRDLQNMIIYAEIKNPNTMIKPILPYLDNLK